MPYTPSPLRYPGGKTQLYSLVKDILYKNSLVDGTYVEPFAGGAGLAIKLLLNGDVDRIVINDFDAAIYAVWYSIIYHTDEFCRLVEKSNLTIEEWSFHKERYGSSKDILELGFSTFYLNRTNVSGVIKGGVIGGKKQRGTYGIDARFNKPGLIKRILKIAEKRDRITLSNEDAIKLIDKFDFEIEKTFINFDPPYVKKGALLYKNAFTENKHIDLSKKILSCPLNWIVTYDICDLVKRLYCSCRHSLLNINYSIGDIREAKEYIFFSNKLILPEKFF